MPQPEAPPAPADRGWLLGAVLAPFLVTRAALLAVAWYARQLAPSWTYVDPVASTRGWEWVPWRWLDVWGRYDTLWYLDVAARGYRVPADVLHQQSNLAFFPLYPWLVRAAHALLPGAWQGDAARYLVAVALANALAVAGLALAYLVVRDAAGDPALARRTVRYALLFPAGFFLSCAYSESLFLCLSAAALLAGQRGRWGWAAAAGALLGLARPTGVLLGLPLAWLYLAQRGWAWRRVRAGLLAAAAPVAGLALHGALLARLTGDPLALFHAQSAWGRTLTAPWTTLLHPHAFHRVMGPLEWACTALFLGLGVLLLARRQAPLGLAALVQVAPVLLSGTLMSATRLLAVAFPAFAGLALLGRRPAVDRAVSAAFAMLQAALFMAWSLFYWVA